MVRDDKCGGRVLRVGDIQWRAAGQGSQLPGEGERGREGSG